jgi:hypothetical protein
VSELAIQLLFHFKLGISLRDNNRQLLNQLLHFLIVLRLKQA